MPKSVVVIGAIASVLVFLLLVLITCLGSFSTVNGGVLTVISGLLSLLIAIVSTIASWFISSHYTIISNKAHSEDKIDTVARQSHEKILNLSKQLFDIQDLIDRAQEIGSKEQDPKAAAVIFLHRLDGIKHCLMQLRTSNDTFSSDWT